MPTEILPQQQRPTPGDVLAMLGAEPMALAPSAVRSLGSPAAFWGWDDEDDDDAGYELVGDLAVITVRGCLMQRACWWWDGYDTLELAFTRALVDGRASAVVLAIDSPGGYVAGLFDCVRRMRAAADASGKRVVAVSDERCYSAAYAVACVADAIVVPQTAGAGSVGVIGTLVSWSAALDAAGVDVRVITSGAEKADGHPSQPLSDGAVAREQARVDQLAEVFFAWVSERRGLARDAVAALEGGIRLGPDAVSAKLADRVGTLAALLGGEITVEECCAPPEEERDADDVPVPDSGDTASHGAAARHTPTPTRIPTMSLQALLAALGATDATQALQSIHNLTSLRTQVHAVTGEADDAKALGAMHAMKRDAAAATELRAQVEADRRAVAAKERASILDGAVQAMQLSPAERAADGTAEGWTTALSNDALRAYTQRAGSAPPPRPREPAKGGANASGASLTDTQRAIADQLGVSHDDYAKALAQG